MTNLSQKSLSPRTLAILTGIFAAAAFRLVPHPPNFAPIGAMALFGGAMLSKRWLAFAAPFGALLLSDAILGFHATMWAVYLAFGLIVALGMVLLKTRSTVRIAGASLAASLLFFIISNFAVWLSGGYPMTLAGLAACYTAAIPFFWNSVAGDLFFSALLFGGFALMERGFPALRDREPLTA